MTIFSKQLTIAIVLLCSLTLNGQDFKSRFGKLSASKDTLGQIALLKEWEQKKPEDAELYVAYYNYYVLKSRKELIGLQTEQQGESSLKLQDSTGQIVGFMNGIVNYDDELVQKGFDYIDKGIKKFPNRLDMRFGKVYILGEIGDYETFTDEIIKTIEYSDTNKNAWLWTDNKPQPDAQQFMLSTIQSYVFQLYETNEDKALDDMRWIAETVLKYYPNHVESLSNLSIVYLVKKDYDKALEQLLKAEKLAPKDYIILNNIAQAFKNKGDKKNAIKYFELTEKHGDSEAKAAAKQELKGLKKK